MQVHCEISTTLPGEQTRVNSAHDNRHSAEHSYSTFFTLFRALVQSDISVPQLGSRFSLPWASSFSCRLACTNSSASSRVTTSTRLMRLLCDTP